MSKIAYKRYGEWSGYTIRESDKGWIIEYTSRIQGELTGRKILMPYTDDFPRGCDLTQEWSDICETGQALAEHDRTPSKVLRKGILVR
jgi:hypothetical protein